MEKLALNGEQMLLEPNKSWRHGAPTKPHARRRREEKKKQCRLAPGPLGNLVAQWFTFCNTLQWCLRNMAMISGCEEIGKTTSSCEWMVSKCERCGSVFELGVHRSKHEIRHYFFSALNVAAEVKKISGGPGVQTCNRRGRGCWFWRGLLFQFKRMENCGATAAMLLLRTAPMQPYAVEWMENFLAMPEPPG